MAQAGLLLSIPKDSGGSRPWLPLEKHLPKKLFGQAALLLLYRIFNHGSHSDEKIHNTRYLQLVEHIEAALA